MSNHSAGNTHASSTQFHHGLTTFPGLRYRSRGLVLSFVSCAASVVSCASVLLLSQKLNTAKQPFANDIVIASSEPGKDTEGYFLLLPLNKVRSIQLSDGGVVIAGINTDTMHRNPNLTILNPGNLVDSADRLSLLKRVESKRRELSYLYGKLFNLIASSENLTPKAAFEAICNEEPEILRFFQTNRTTLWLPASRQDWCRLAEKNRPLMLFAPADECAMQLSPARDYLVWQSPSASIAKLPDEDQFWATWTPANRPRPTIDIDKKALPIIKVFDNQRGTNR